MIGKGGFKGLEGIWWVEEGKGRRDGVVWRVEGKEGKGRRRLTAAFEAPPLAPGAGVALLKEKTIAFFSASPVKSDCPDVRRRWNRLIADGAEDRSRNS